jgi:GNAT superfamily N-acetyltransferase
VNDEAVAGALFDAARDWLRARGMTRAIGPFNFNTNHEFGLLVDGFEHDPYILNPYNAAYYPEIYEALGFRPAMDWYAYRVQTDLPGIKQIRRVGERLLARHPEIQIRNLELARYDEELASIHRIYDDAWEQNWAHVRVSEKEFRFMAEGLKQILDPNLCFMVESEGRPIGMSVTLPDFNQVLKKMKGKILPFGWRHMIRPTRHIDRIRVFMLGVAQEFQHLPIGAALYARTFNTAVARGYRDGEASLILENNVRMRGALEKMGAPVEKTYRNYEIQLGS